MSNKNNELVRKDMYGMDPFFNDFFNFPFFENRKNHHPIMKTDIKTNGDSYTLAIDIPGFSKDEITISMEDGYLTVNASKKEETNTEEKNYVRHERFSGSYSRSFYVGEISEEKINAKLENGVLTIIIPKEIEEQPVKKYIESK